MTRPDRDHPLLVPRVARKLVRHSAAIAARDLGGLDRSDPHVLVHGSEDRVKHVIMPALENIDWKGPRLVCEPDPVAFARWVNRPSVEAAALAPDPRSRLDFTLLLLRGLVRRLRERVPTVLLDCPEAALADAYAHGFDLVTPPLRGIYPAAHALEDALRLRTLFRDGCGQGVLDAERPTGTDAPRGRVAIVGQPGNVLDDVVEQLISVGFAWETRGDGTSAARTLTSELTRFDLVLIQGNMPELDGIDLLRLLRSSHAHLPPCVLHFDTVTPSLVESAWHVGAWAWCSTACLRGGLLPDLLRRAMNLSRAHRREAREGLGRLGVND